MKQLLLKIEFWIIIFFLVRMIGITNPPLEAGHNWRQVTGLMVSRNYLEVDSKIMYPRIDDNNGETGIIGMEFPLMNYTFYAISKLFGFEHWYGRLINLIISSLGLLYFHKLLILFRFNSKIAFTSTLFLATSIWFTFSRKMMPDTFCISLVLIGLYYGIKYLDHKKTGYLLLYILISSMAILSKISAGIYFVILGPLLLSQDYSLKPKIVLTFSTIIPISLTYYWYFIWNPHLSIEFGNWYNIGNPFTIGFREIIENLNATLANFYFNAFSSYFIFALFLIGFAIILYKKERKTITIFFLFFAVFLVYIFKSGHFFYNHSYYIIPFVPIMALIAGNAVALINKKWLYVAILFLGIGESIANQQHDFFIKDSEKYKLSLENIMDSISKQDDLILINGNGNPQLIYLSHRKGWNCSDEQLLDTSYLSTVISKGCKYIIVNKHSQKNTDLLFKRAFENDDFLIYKTKTASEY
jgi:hypothetical protein